MVIDTSEGLWGQMVSRSGGSGSSSTSLIGESGSWTDGDGAGGVGAGGTVGRCMVVGGRHFRAGVGRLTGRGSCWVAGDEDVAGWRRLAGSGLAVFVDRRYLGFFGAEVAKSQVIVTASFVG